MSEKRVHLIIHGRVQGVGYRAWTRANAKKKKLKGWVRNRLNGTVEAALVGPEDKVDLMIKKCKDGPLSSRVTDIVVTEYQEDVSDVFEVLPTG